MAELILICEDEAITSLRLRASLSAMGYSEIAEASDGAQAVLLARKLRPDVILMDVNMPGMDGIEALRQILPDAPTAVVMLTAYSDPETIQRALHAGASGYLVKPFCDKQLAAAISVALDRFQDLQRERQAAKAAAAAADRQIHEGLERIADLGVALQGERAIARALAESFLSPTPTCIPELRIETAYEPASAAKLIGGDFFDFIQLGDQRLGIVIADACGKGLPAAALTAVTRHMLRAYAWDDPTPGTVLRRLNRALCNQTSHECAFITLVYGVLDLTNFEFVYGNAGHPAPILWDPSAGSCLPLPPTGGLLGALPEWEWASASVQIPPGGALMLFTDGITEARCGGEMLESAGAETAILDLLREPSADLAIGLKDRARNFAGGELKDDVAVVAVRRPLSGECQSSVAEAITTTHCTFRHFAESPVQTVRGPDPRARQLAVRRIGAGSRTVRATATKCAKPGCPSEMG